jgi:hypothetical protein
MHDLSCMVGCFWKIRTIPACTAPSTLKFSDAIFFDGVPKPNELRFTLRGWSTAHAVHVVQCYAADLAFDDSFVARPHREFEHHLVGIVEPMIQPRVSSISDVSPGLQLLNN